MDGQPRVNKAQGGRGRKEGREWGVDQGLSAASIAQHLSREGVVLEC